MVKHKKLFPIWARQLSIVVIGIVVLAVLFIKSKAVDTEMHTRITKSIFALKAQDSKVNEELIESRAGMLDNYDPLVRHINKLYLLTDNLYAELKPLEIENFDVSWKELMRLISEKESNIESFKSHYAVLTNSLRFLPLAVEQLIQGNSSDSIRNLKNNDIKTLLRDVFTYYVNGNAEDKSKILEEIQRLSTIDETITPETKELLYTAISHSSKVVEYMSEVEEHLIEAYKIPIDELIETISEQYQDQHDQLVSQSAKYRIALFILSTLLFVVVIFTLLRLSLFSRRLKESLTELNFQKFALDQHAIVSIADVKGNITYVNDKFCEISGYTLDELLGKNHRVVKSEEHPTEFFKEMWQTIANGNVWHGEIKNSTKAGGFYWVASTIVPLLNDQGKPFQYVSIRTDITTRKNMESELEEAIKIADNANQMKGDFLANMSHEIRTPMNAIIGLSHLTLQSDLTTEQHDFLSKIESSSKHLLGLINDILDFSKIEAGKMTLESTPYNLEEIFEHIISAVNPKALEKDVELLVDIDNAIPNQLIGDPLRLSQILLNLANNAIKFTAQGNVTISVKQIIPNSNGAKLRFDVIDSGIGISDEEQGRLFTSFSQADTSTTRKYGGTGLGLAISKQLSEMMGGEIGVESEPNKGSDFWFTIDLIENKSSEPSILKLPERLAGFRTLIVENSKQSAQIISAILENFGLNVSVTSSGFEALSILESTQTDPVELLVVNQQLSEMGGDELVDNVLKKIKAPLKILVITSQGIQEAVSRFPAISPKTIIQKPILPSHLFNTVMQVFGEETPSHEEEKQAPQEIDTLQGARILLAEDNMVNQLVATKILEKFGAEVTIANNGAEAVELVGSDIFDIVLMDVQMPVMDGYLATKKIRELHQGKELPIIAMTAHAMASDYERSIAEGMNGHITKPIEPDVLINTLSDWLGATLPVTTQVEEPMNNFHRSIPSKISGINIEEGLEYSMGDQQLYLRVLNSFYNQFNSAIHSLHDAPDQDNGRHIAHSLKGVCSTIGASEISEIASQLEAAYESGEGDIDTLIEQLGLLLTPLMKDLDKLFEENSPKEGEKH